MNRLIQWIKVSLFGTVLFVLFTAAACNGDDGDEDAVPDMPGEETPDTTEVDTTGDVPADNLVEVDWLDEPCPGTWIDLAHAPTDLILMVNRSSTMLLPADGHEPTSGELGTCAEDNYGPASGITYVTLWEEVTGALGNAVVTHQGRINQGLMLYPGPGLVGTGMIDSEHFCEGSVTDPQIQVSPELNSAADIQSTLTSADNYPICDVGMSNLGQALENVGTALGRSGAGPDVLVVVTDSGPNCNIYMTPCNEEDCTYEIQYCDGTVGTIGCLDDARAISTLTTMLSDGIKTYVVGVPGSDALADVFDSLAAAGGTTEHHAAAAAMDITTAVEGIAEAELSCVFELSAAADPVNVNVLVDGAPIVRDDANGFSFDEATRIVTLLGTACDDFLAGSAGEIQLLSGCPPFGG